MATPNTTKTKILQGKIDFANDTIKVALYNDSTSYSFDPDSPEFLNDILDGGTTAQEFGGSGGTGYTRKSLANQSVSTDDPDDEAVFDADDLSWSSLDGETIQGVIIYKQVGGDDSTPGDDPVLSVFDSAQISEFPLPTSGAQVDLSWATEGIKNLT